jgi:hypothetical protein
MIKLFFFGCEQQPKHRRETMLGKIDRLSMKWNIRGREKKHKQKWYIIDNQSLATIISQYGQFNSDRRY